MVRQRPPSHVTIMFVPDGTAARSGWRVRTWLLRGLIIAQATLVLGIIVFFALYGKVLERAARTEEFASENERLRRYSLKVQLLEQQLMDAREIVARVTALAGIDYQFAELPSDSLILAADTNALRGAILPRSADGDWSIPSGLPVQGFITQYFSGDSTTWHPGIDIACATGVPVLATGSGVVTSVIYDSIYGHTVTLAHNDSITTVYAHNEKILVAEGETVQVGSRIALAGNSGRSTAPHVHYEVNIHGKPVNPLDNLYAKEDTHHE